MSRMMMMVALLSVGCALASCQTPVPELIDIGQVPAFAFEDEQGGALGTAQLKGKPYAVNFLFTSCPTSCPPLANATAALQTRIKDWAEGPDYPVRLVSLTVDPVTDTPEKLKQFGEAYGSDPAVWRFARGEYTEMEKLVTEGFMMPIIRKDASRAKSVEARDKLLASEPTPLDTAHSLRFVLVDGEGRIRGLFDKTDEDLDKLDAALRHLAGR